MQVAFRGAHRGLFIFIGVWTALCVVGCGGRSLKEAPSKNVDLTGEWQLNAALSDDVQKALRAQLKIMNERMDRDRGPQQMGPMRRPTEGMRRNTDDSRPESEEDRDPGGMRKIHKQREERFTSMVEAPSSMQIAVKGARFIVKHDGTNDEYTAGAKSVVSFGRDVADRSSGWSGNEFIVSTRGVEGGAKEDRYSLQTDGRLLFITKLSGDRMPTLEIKRVYDRSKS